MRNKLILIIFDIQIQFRRYLKQYKPNKLFNQISNKHNFKYTIKIKGY